MLPGRITIKDVAQHAKVSVTTVSRVLNKSESVRTSTRQRVEQVLTDLGFSRDPIATALRTGRSNTVHLLIERFDGTFIPDILVGIEAQADAKGYGVLVSKLHPEAEAVRQPDKYYIDGIIIISDSVHDLCLDSKLGSDAVPLVCVYSYSQDIRYPCVLPDDFQGAYLAVEHLAAKGCKEVGYIGGIPHWPASIDRLRGYQQAVRDLNLREDPSLIEVGDWTAGSGYEGCRRMLQKTRFDGIFASNDPIAIGAMDALGEHRLRVPEDVAVIGFDNTSLGRYVRPTLSSIAMPLRELGEIAMDLVVSLIEANGTREPYDSAHIIKIPCSLRERASTKRSSTQLDCS